MKKTIIVCLFLFFGAFLRGQSLKEIEVNLFTATYLYFEEEVIKMPEIGIIESFDLSYEENIVKVTPLTENIDFKTNLTVTTSEGVYAFFLVYKKDPDKLYYNVSKEEKMQGLNLLINEPKAVLLVEEEVEEYNQSQKKIEESCAKILQDYTGSAVAFDTKGGIRFNIAPILVKEDKMYFLLNIENYSQIRFDIETLHLTIIPRKKRGKRSVSVPDKMIPIYIYNETIQHINPKGQKGDFLQFVYVVEKFTIDKDKQLRIELFEQNGERHLSLFVNQYHVTNALAF